MLYNNNDIKDAKAYIKTRLSAEHSFSHNLEVAILLAAEKIVKLCKSLNIDPKDIATTRSIRFQMELDKIMQQLEDDLYDMIEKLCVYADNEDKEYIVSFINKEIMGLTLSSRLKSHVNSLKNTIIDSFAKGGFNISKSIVKYGGGHKLDVLGRNTIARTYNEEWKKQHPGAIGFYSWRGSSYPCSHCDDEVGYHPISEYPTWGGWHPNCCCIFTFVNQ